jgi:hypothetical protein
MISAQNAVCACRDGKPLHTFPDHALADCGLMTDPNQDDGDNRRGALAGLVIAIVLLAVGIWLARDLSAASKMQDCLMSGRTNCNTIEPAR